MDNEEHKKAGEETTEALREQALQALREQEEVRYVASQEPGGRWVIVGEVRNAAMPPGALPRVRYRQEVPSGKLAHQLVRDLNIAEALLRRIRSPESETLATLISIRRELAKKTHQIRQLVRRINNTQKEID